MEATDPILQNLLLVLLLSVGVVALFHRLRLPSIAGFIVVGVLAGPHGFSLVRNVAAVEVLTRLGVVLLLFSIGLEFSVNRLRRTWKVLLEGGIPYVLLTGAAAYLCARLVGVAHPGSVFIGFWVSLSSTAIVLKTLADRGELDTPYGRLVLAILLFQDLCVVPMILLLPVLGGSSGVIGPGAAGILLRSIVILLAVLIISRYVVPPLLSYVARTRNRELFLLLIFLICLGTAGAAHGMGLSAALGAFLGGLLLSKSDYGIQALSDILPFRDIFNSIFFMSIGMLLDLGAFTAHPVGVTLTAAGILGMKAAVGLGITILLGFPVRVALLSGLALANVGEFSFILAQAGHGLGLVSDDLFQTLLAGSILTMAVAPLLIALAPKMAYRAERVGYLTLRFRKRPPEEGQPDAKSMGDHVVVVGYGLNGRNLARILAAEGIPYLVLDVNARTVRAARRRGEPIIFGDVTSEKIASRLGLEHARMLTIMISDAEATRRAVHRVRGAYPQVPILVRTRYVSEVDELYRLGASEVVPEEFETSLEIAARTLARFGKPAEQIRQILQSVRAQRYQALRPALAERPPAGPAEPPAVETVAHQIKEGAPVIGLSIAELDLQGRTGARILSILRDGETMSRPSPGLILDAGDLLVLLGATEQLDAAEALLRGEIAEEVSDAGISPDP